MRTNTTRGGSWVVTVTVLLLAGFTMTTGVWALLSPASFADAVQFPNHEHFLHDIGAFQIGLATMLLLALIWEDSLAVALAGFLVANTIHTVNHVMDLDLGGQDYVPWALGLLSVLTAAALGIRWSQLGKVFGRVDGPPPAAASTIPPLAPFVRQKTVALTTYRRDGTAVATPVSIVVDGDRAYVRSYEKAGKTRRLRRDARVVVAPSTTRGTPTGPGIEGRAHRLDPVEARHAARLLARKYPLLHGVGVPLMHRLGRRKTGRTVHFELDATPQGPA